MKILKNPTQNEFAIIGHCLFVISESNLKHISQSEAEYYKDNWTRCENNFETRNEILNLFQKKLML